jgi:putative iron-regulated protein
LGFFKLTQYILGCAVLAAPAIGISQDNTPASAQADNITSKVVSNYTAGVYQSYTNSLRNAETLQKVIMDFTQAPTTVSLDKAKEAWITAHKVYSPTEVFRFYEGPIDAAEGGPEPLINAWPLDEAYIDYVEGDPDAGIINMPAEYPEIGRDLLVSMNEKDGEKNISTGYHAIEFLLWGQDQSETGPGARPVSDYLSTSSKHAARRAKYLQQTADLLVDNLKSVQSAWKPDAANYRADFENLDGQEALQRIFTGIIMMAGDELSQERMVVPLETGDQEDEQSCFSDTTLSDLQLNLSGIRQVYTGAIHGINGPGIGSVVAAKDPVAHAGVEKALQTAEAAMQAIPAPFDQALKSEQGKEKIEAAITALEDLAQALLKAAAAVNVTVNLS